MATHKEVKSFLASLIAQAMYMEEEEIQENELFSNFGLESVTLVKLVAKINEKYSISVQPTVILKHQTLREASAFVFEEIVSQTAQRGD